MSTQTIKFPKSLLQDSSPLLDALLLQGIEVLNHSKVITEYCKALAFMEDRVEQIIAKQANQLIWLVQHDHLYTAGTSTNEEEIVDLTNKISSFSPQQVVNPLSKTEALQKQEGTQVKFYRTGRGGKMTYHGPGQLIIYLMLNVSQLHNQNPDVRLFIKQIENWLIKTLASVGVACLTIDQYPGIWVNQPSYEDEARYAKIAALGVRLRKWVSYHGVALNISPSLKYFDMITPCGLKRDQYDVISIEKLGFFPHKVNEDLIINTLLHTFINTFFPERFKISQ